MEEKHIGLGDTIRWNDYRGKKYQGEVYHIEYDQVGWPIRLVPKSYYAGDKVEDRFCAPASEAVFVRKRVKKKVLRSSAARENTATDNALAKDC